MHENENSENFVVHAEALKTTDGSFESLGLSEPILKTIHHVGFQHPTPIQQAVIPTALQGRDIIGLAQTGSGKTAAFSLPLAERLTHGEGVRGLILSPTREIALQTKAFLDLFGKFHHLKTTCLIGGVKMGPQITSLKKHPDIIVATPGRLLDHMDRGFVRLDQIQELVLDEADHMLDLGFMPQLKAILREVPEQRHTMMFSATMPMSIESLAHRYLKDPFRVDILPEGRTAEGIEHRLYLIEPEFKKDCLLSLIKEEVGRILIFTRTKVDANWLFRILETAGEKVERLHSDRTQGQRVQALEGFRNSDHRILVATDIAARGIDVPGIEHIINYDLPENVEDYIHRAGRTARAQKKGVVSSIATWLDKEMVDAIDKVLQNPMNRCEAPGIPAYVEKKFKAFSKRDRRKGKLF